jgi:3-dehydroquinate synthase
MNKITLPLEDRSSHLYFPDGKRDRLAETLSRHFKSSRWVIVTNPTVNRLYGPSLRKELGGLGEVKVLLMPDGERFKTLKTAEKIYRTLSAWKIDRKTPLIALGGGVVGDVAGFVAATYLRGIPLVQIPTTLLAQVDSSVGGKTGVDLPTGKNLVGAFYQPHVVWIDVSFLRTLPGREILCGAAEVIKYGIIKSPRLFAALEGKIRFFLDLDPPLTRRVVEECVRIKADVVRRDEKETKGLRMILNYGHTLGHAVETLSGYSRFSHGEAIAIGMAFAARLSRSLRLTKEDTEERILHLLREAGLPFKLPKFSRMAYISTIARDKKMARGKIRYVLVRRIGSVVVKELELGRVGQEIEKSLKP